MIAPSTWPRSTSIGGSFASSSTLDAEISRPDMTPPRISRTFVSRAESASAFATATMSPSASMNAIADGPSRRASSASDAGGLCRAAGERVLDDREPRPVLEQPPTQGVDLGHRQAAVIGDEERLRVAEPLRQLGDHAFLVLFLHFTSLRNRPALRRADFAREGLQEAVPPRMDFCLSAAICLWRGRLLKPRPSRPPHSPKSRRALRRSPGSGWDRRGSPAPSWR